MAVVKCTDSKAGDIGSAGHTGKEFGASQMDHFITCRQMIDVASLVLRESG